MIPAAIDIEKIPQACTCLPCFAEDVVRGVLVVGLDVPELPPAIDVIAARGGVPVIAPRSGPPVSIRILDGIDDVKVEVLMNIVDSTMAVVVVVGLATAKLEVSVAIGRKFGEYVAVPEYCGQPGTSVFGGARPPPQSRNEHISPVPGT